jgi:Restriction endonuclease
VISNQQRDVIQPDIQGIDNDVTSKTITSGSSCSGMLSHTYGHIDTGYPVCQNPQDVSEVTIENPSSLPCSGPFFSSHLETIGYTPPPTYYIPPYIPLIYPIDPSYLLEKLKELGGIPFEIYLKGFLEYLCYQVEQTKSSHDMGGDLIAKRLDETLVIQAKNWKTKTVGEDVIREAIAAKIFYDGTRAIVISTGKISPDAKKLAEKIGVEYWDGERLIEELKKYGYFRLP